MADNNIFSRVGQSAFNPGGYGMGAIWQMMRDRAKENAGSEDNSSDETQSASSGGSSGHSSGSGGESSKKKKKKKKKKNKIRTAGESMTGEQSSAEFSGKDPSKNPSESTTGQQTSAEFSNGKPVSNNNSQGQTNSGMTQNPELMAALGNFLNRFPGFFGGANLTGMNGYGGGGGSAMGGMGGGSAMGGMGGMGGMAPAQNQNGAVQRQSVNGWPAQNNRLATMGNMNAAGNGGYRPTGLSPLGSMKPAGQMNSGGVNSQPSTLITGMPLLNGMYYR